MNEWQVTAILLKDAVIVEKDGDRTINFNALNTEAPKDNRGNYTRPIKTYIDCQWIKPDMKLLPLLKKGAFVYLRGKPYPREFRRSDDSGGIAQGMTATEVVYHKQINPEASPDESFREAE